MKVNYWVIIVGIVLLFIFILFCINIATLKKIDKEKNKDLVESKTYSIALYGSIIFLVLIVAFVAYYIYMYSKGKKIFCNTSSSTDSGKNEKVQINDLINTLKGGEEIKQYEVSKS